ncbi:MAG: CPBP family intramembrane metalloprotease [Lachnospiraceae bacterium]|nr:CPBP family intramembrane metalloprotease [Lachnospiraceae bacterium]
MTDNKSAEKKKLWIFIAIAYGLVAVMSIFMYIGFRRQYDITAFVNLQMMYPACGVILGKLITKSDDDKLPMAGYITVLATTAVMLVMAVLSLFWRIGPIMAAGQVIDVWNLLSQFPIMFGSVITYILFWTCGREKRENAGIERRNIRLSVILVAVFIALVIGRCMIAVFLEDFRTGTDKELQAVLAVCRSPLTWVTLLVLPVNFIMSFIAFFGEEYGWRYYLQPLMQRRFGKRAGVLLLGLVWALWHIDVDFMFYAKDYGLQAVASQIMTCVASAVFLGYAYMKTENIWVPVIMHYLYNNLGAIISGGSDSLKDQVIEWNMLPAMAASFIVFFLFIFMPIYRRDAAASPEQ